MRKRDMEVQTQFSTRIKEDCHIYDLQGLCKDKNGNYSMAVEAIDMGNDPVEAFIEVFSDEELYAKAKLAERIGTVLFLLLHKREKMGQEKKDEIYIEKVQAEGAELVNLSRENKLSEEYFVNWWRARKFGAQKKEYGDEMSDLISSSYFDSLLERNNSSWSGNIDGFLMKDGNVSALIECRFSSEKEIENYDPGKFFEKDKVVWNELYSLSTRLGVPLYLFTYSRLLASRQKVGITKIEEVTAEGLKYYKDTKPCNNILESSEQVLDWIENNP